MSKVVVVTAASRGIGAATARAFGRAGYDVVVNYNKSHAEAEKVVADIKAAGQNAIAVQADVFTEEGVQKLFAETVKTYPRIDVLVNNAAGPSREQFGDFTFQVITKNFMSNFASAVMCSQAAVPFMSRGGSILFTSSIYGLPHGGSKGVQLYSAAKAALNNFSETLAARLASRQIRCNVVAPGFTKTELWGKASEEYIAVHHATTLQNEWVQPEEIGAAFVFLAETPHMNATTIVVDAGWTKKQDTAL